MIGRRIPFGQAGIGPRVLLSIPTSGRLDKTVALAVLDIALSERRMHGDIVMPTDRPYESNLNQIVLDVLEKRYDFWCSIDDDNAPTRNPLDLALLNLDVVGCPTPVWHNTKPGDRPWYLNAYDERGDPLSPTGGWNEHKPWNGLQEVDAVGTGCFIVARRVLERIDPGPFMRIWSKTGIAEVGNDLAFCYRAKRAGFKIWAHYDYRCHHRKEVFDLLEMIEAMEQIRG